jgi:NADH dehydrogenase FAD-containing subunit
MVYMGRNMAVAQLGPVTFDGIAAAMLRRALYTGQILTYLGPFTAVRSKTSATLVWLFS